jgi:hypothetical protein
LSIGGAEGDVSPDVGISESFWLFLRRRRWTRVVVVSTGGGQQQRFTLKTQYTQHPQHIIVISSEVIALRKICGRLFTAVGSSVIQPLDDV